MLDEHVPDPAGVTLGADAGYRERGITPHVAQTRDRRRRSAVDGRTVRHAVYEVSQRIRKRVEEGQARTQLAAHLVAAAYNLLRISKLVPA